MGLVEELGEMAIVSRFRRLADRMNQDNAQIFREEQIGYDPRWYLLFYLLDTRAPLSIMEVAKALGITHPTVNQLAEEIIKRGFIRAESDPKDKRRRLLSLTPTGKILLEDLKPIWQAMYAAARDVVTDSGYDVIGVLTSIEKVLNQTSYYERTRVHLEKMAWSAIKIHCNDAACLPYFRTLNDAWQGLSETVLEADKLLADPDKLIIQKGGFVFFARYHDKIVGTCALLLRSKSQWELAYLVVDEAYRQKHIGQKLVKSAMTIVKEQGGKILKVEVHHQQVHAISFFRHLGFLSVSKKATPRDARHDIQLEYTF